LPAWCKMVVKLHLKMGSLVVGGLDGFVRGIQRFP
jgi:hypothetical protein